MKICMTFLESKKEKREKMSDLIIGIKYFDSLEGGNVYETTIYFIRKKGKKRKFLE
jgi:hypothetical protein